MKNTRESNEHLKSKADEIIAAALPVDLQSTLAQWKAARKLRAETGCHLSTAKRHVRDAIARATGNEPQREWGGARRGGGFTAEKRAELEKGEGNEPG